MDPTHLNRITNQFRSRLYPQFFRGSGFACLNSPTPKPCCEANLFTGWPEQYDATLQVRDHLICYRKLTAPTWFTNCHHRSVMHLDDSLG
jgi:hypothetical protein